MLCERYDIDYLRRNLMPTEAWHPFPRAADRSAWQALLAHSLNRERRAFVVGYAEALVGKAWPELTATLYIEYARNGTTPYRAPFYLRRRNLGTLVLAECMEYQGRFVDEIINGLWAISEEATWAIPAHARNAPDPLPNADLEMVDLFAAETAMVAAETLYLLGDELRRVSPSLVRRIERECLRRVIEPVETREDWTWFSGHNNWTPWICSNVLGVALYLLSDEERIARLTFRLMGLVDRFIGHYGPDGGCNEGPSYWGAAAGAMLLFLEHLHSRSSGAIDVYSEPLIRAMGRFIVDTHLAGPWFCTFADTPGRIDMRRAVTYRYGERIGCALMQDAALLSARAWDTRADVWPPIQLRGSGSLTHGLREIFWIPPDSEPVGARNDLHTWFPDLQVLVARERSEPNDGLVLAAKGGHNGESHNHNDLGQFIVLLDGQPAILDVGVETYCRKTFSSERYDIWCIRSTGHNVPLVNGYEQLAGEAYKATGVTHVSTHDGDQVSMNLEGAYPKEVGVESLRREITFQRRPGASVTVRDCYTTSDGPLRIAVPLLTTLDVTMLAPGTLALDANPRRLLIHYDPTLQLSVEPMALKDQRMQDCWGQQLNRITLTHEGDASAGEYTLRFEAEG